MNTQYFIYANKMRFFCTQRSEDAKEIENKWI